MQNWTKYDAINNGSVHDKNLLIPQEKNEDFLPVLVLTLTKKVYFLSINDTQQKNVITFGGCSPDSV